MGMPENKQKISSRIKEALAIRGLKQADLVRMTGIGKSSISTYISGAYDLKQQNTFLIAKAIDVIEAWLMGYDLPMERTYPEYDMVYGQRLKNLRESRGLNHAQLADMYNEAYPVRLFSDKLTDEYICCLESGQREITYELAIRFSRLMEASPEEILDGWTSYMLGYADMRYRLTEIYDNLDFNKHEKLLNFAEDMASATPSKPYRIACAYDKASPPVQRIVEVALEPFMDKNIIDINFSPVRYTKQAASAGIGIYLDDEDMSTIMVRSDILPKGECFALPVDGDSMDPCYHDGDILLVCKVPVNVGEIGIFTMQNQGYVKQLGRGVLQSLNSKYADIPLTEDIICSGKVIGIIE